MPMKMMDDISLKSFLTPDVQKRLSKLKSCDVNVVSDIYEIADALALSVRDATLVSIACSLAKLRELRE
jgi:hypothetical protein